MKFREATIAWTPADMPNPDGTMPNEPEGWKGRVIVAARARVGDADDYSHQAQTVATPPDEVVRTLLGLFHMMVVRDGVDLRAAHAALLNIEEYAQALAYDH